MDNNDTPQSTLLAARNAALYYSKRQQARDNMLTPLSEVEAFREGYEEGAGSLLKDYNKRAVNGFIWCVILYFVLLALGVGALYFFSE